MQIKMLNAFICLLIFTVFGCGSSYTIEIVDDLIYIELSEGAAGNVGEVFAIFKNVKKQRPAYGWSAPPEHTKMKIGRVRVVKMADDKHALVEVLDGYIERDCTVAKEDLNDSQSITAPKQKDRRPERDVPALILITGSNTGKPRV